MTVYDDVKWPVCAVPSEAYHQVVAALLRAVEVLGNIRAPVPVPLSLIDEILAQARAALRLDVALSAGGARQTAQPMRAADLARFGLEADARLIAAAPDLLDACKAALDFWHSHEAWGDFASLNSAAAAFAPVADRARAALLKVYPEEDTE